MADILRIDTPTLEQIRVILSQSGDELTEEQIAALRHFLDRVGGVENAQMAVKMLRAMAA